MSDRWDLRGVAPELEARWRADGLWNDETLGTVLERGLRTHASQTFEIHSSTRAWRGTFGEVHERARRVAGALRERGVGPGDPVAFQLPNWVEAAVTFYAACELGAVVVPIVHFYGPKEVGYILRRTGVRAFVTASRFGTTDYLAGLEGLRDVVDDMAVVAIVGHGEAPGSARPLPRGLTAFSELETGAPVNHPAAVDPQSPALVAYTSGTTADPKGVIHSHQTIGSEVRQLGAMSANGGRPHLTGAPVGHAMGMLGALLIPVVGGDPVHLVDVWDPPRLLALMAEHHLACGSGATFFLTSLLDHPDRTPAHTELMRFVGLGGAAVPAAVAERARDEGISIVRMYGSTEHPSITGATHDEPEVKRLTTDGRPMVGVDIRLVDDDGLDVPRGVPGEIWSRGPDCFVGYTDAALTAAAFDEGGWYRTEDIGVLDDEGYLRITDRKKDVIIRGGENVSAAEVEELIAAMPAVAEVAVVAAPSERLGEQVCAFVRMLPGAVPMDLAALRASLGEAGLSRAKWPELLHLVQDLPRTPSGKVKKAVLRATAREGVP
ncbi:MAG: AMP-binding protein [Actinomycetota bacterium]|nr:AMP-binding protein [Actinomycetota bacterium]